MPSALAGAVANPGRNATATTYSVGNSSLKSHSDCDDVLRAHATLRRIQCLSPNCDSKDKKLEYITLSASLVWATYERAVSRTSESAASSMQS